MQFVRAWLGVVLLAVFAAAHAQRTAPPDVPSDRLIVKWRAGTAAHAHIRGARDGRISPAVLDAFAKRAGVRIDRKSVV